jgi:hypothetical protein
MTCSLTAAGERSENAYAVVTAEYRGTTVGNKDSFTFLPGELVKIKRIHRESALVESAARDWATTGGVWIPREFMALKSTFKRLEKWTGERHIEVVAGDYAADYTLNLSGGFKLKMFNENGRPVVVTGQLYKSKNVLWARAVNGNAMHSQDLFLVMPDGKLCWLTPVEDCSSP